MQHENLWAPWRMAYLRDLERRTDAASDGPDPAPGTVDFIADYWAHPEDDLRNHVLHRDAHGMVMLNRYPYSGGHLLVALGEARPSLLDYDADQRAALWRLVDLATDLLQRAVDPQGVNIGVNQGRAAGAGLPEHLHVHLVPRWHADTNFITAVGAVRVVPAGLEQMDEVMRRYVADVVTDFGG